MGLRRSGLRSYRGEPKGRHVFPNRQMDSGSCSDTCLSLFLLQTQDPLPGFFWSVPSVKFSNFLFAPNKVRSGMSTTVTPTSTRRSRGDSRGNCWGGRGLRFQPLQVTICVSRKLVGPASPQRGAERILHPPAPQIRPQYEVALCDTFTENRSFYWILVGEKAQRMGNSQGGLWALGPAIP